MRKPILILLGLFLTFSMSIAGQTSNSTSNSSQIPKTPEDIIRICKKDTSKCIDDILANSIDIGSICKEDTSKCIAILESIDIGSICQKGTSICTNIVKSIERGVCKKDTDISKCVAILGYIAKQIDSHRPPELPEDVIKTCEENIFKCIDISPKDIKESIEFHKKLCFYADVRPGLYENCRIVLVTLDQLITFKKKYSTEYGINVEEEEVKKLKKEIKKRIISKLLPKYENLCEKEKDCRGLDELVHLVKSELESFDRIHYFNLLCNKGISYYCKLKDTAVKELGYKNSCEKENDASACYKLTLIYSKEFYDEDKALYYADKSCKLGNKKGCYWRDYYIAREEKYNGNYQKAAYIFGKLCRETEESELQWRTCDTAAEIYYKRLHRYKTAKDYAEIGCKIRNPGACFILRNVKKSIEDILSFTEDFVNNNVTWEGGKYIVCGSGTTEFEIMQSELGEVLTELSDTRFGVKRTIKLENFCNNLAELQLHLTTKTAKKMYIILAEGWIDALGSDRNNIEAKTNKFLYLVKYAKLKDGRGAYRGHLVFTRIILEFIIKQSMEFDRTINERSRKLISYLLEGKLGKAIKYAEESVSDKELDEITKYIENKRKKALM